MRLSFLSAALALALTSRAFGGAEGVGTSSAAFVKLGAGARPESMGEAYVAASDDASGIAFNPAGMSQMLAGELDLTHTEWFQGLRYEDINAVFSLGEGGMIGTTFNFLSIPSITRTQQIANTSDPSLNYVTTGAFSPDDMTFGLAYSRPLLGNLLGGLNFKVLSQSIDSYSTMGLALDLGALYEMKSVRGLSLGLSVQNLGTPITLHQEAFQLPLIARLGASYRAMDDRLLLLLEGDLPSDVAPVLALGLEYNFSDRFFPRLGYRYDSIFDPWTVGLGVKFEPLALDLSIVPYGDLGLTYRASLIYHFGSPVAELTTKLAYLSSNGSGKNAVIEPHITAPDKVLAWALYIYDAGHPNKLVRQMQGRGPLQAQLIWDGRLEDGSPAAEGQYWAVLSARYSTGKTVTTKYLGLQVNNAVPQVDLGLDGVSLNKDAPGEAFVPTQFVTTHKGPEAAHWRLEILDPLGAVFRNIRGDGNPPPTGLFWDGKGDGGDELVSGQVYQARIRIFDAMGNEALSATPVSFRAVFR
jgi:hypothetical protein